MVEDDIRLDRVFRALASAPRREILRRVARERHTVGDLAAQFDMSLAAVSKHIGVLQDAELIMQSRDGTRQWCRLNPTPLEGALETVEELRSFWNGQLDALEALLVDAKPVLATKPQRRKRS